jgi:hypothetical protein
MGIHPCHAHPHLVPLGLNQWAHTATQLYTNKELAQTVGRHSYWLDWQAACQGLSKSVLSYTVIRFQHGQ